VRGAPGGDGGQQLRVDGPLDEVLPGRRLLGPAALRQREQQLVELVQLALLAVVGLALGWSPRGSVLGFVVLVALGTAAFSGLGLLLGGTLRGLTSLAAANLLWLVLLVLGGMVFPLSAFGPAEDALRLLPTAALSGGLREVLQDGVALPGAEALVLAVWALAGLALAARLFRWE